MSELFSATPYDDAFKTLLHDCKRLIIPFVNEIFGKNYDSDLEVTFENTEFLDTLENGEQKRTREDSVFTIGNDPIRYHIECQTNADSSILIRIFEYDTHIARILSSEENGRMVFRFPASAVFYLRGSSVKPGEYPARIVFPGGQYVDFSIPVIRMRDYSLEELFQKNLHLMLPFYLFNLEREVKRNNGDRNSVAAVEAALQEIIRGLQANRDSERLNVQEYYCLTTMIKKVGENLMKPYDAVLEGVEKIMGGTILEYESKTIYNEGLKAGEETMKEKLLSLWEEFVNGDTMKGKTNVAEDPNFMKELLSKLS